MGAMDDRERVERFLAEKPWARDALEAILAADADAWVFDDLPLDSGRFGEVVSRGFVEEADGGYRLRDRGAVEAALRDGGTEDAAAADDGDATAATGGSAEAFDGRLRDIGGGGSTTVADVGSTVAVPLAVLVLPLAIVVLTRAYIYLDVFRRGDVLLLSNDPYYYRVLVERLPRYADSGRVLRGEPLMITSLRAAADAVGAGGDAGAVLAWYPVASAVVTAAMVYGVARLASGERLVGGDRLVGGAAVLALATMPAHAFRTALGFADHHAFDYPWLALTLLALVALATARESRRRWLAAAGLAAGVAGQVLAWDHGAVLLPAAGLAVVGSTLVAARDDGPVAGLLRPHAPHLAGLGAAAALVLTANLALGWHTTVVALVPVLLFAGCAGAVAAAAWVRRRRPDAGAATVGAAQLGVGGAVAVVAWLAVPGLADRVAEGAARIAADRSVAETRSLLAAVGDDPLLGPLVPFGVAVLALPVAALVLRRSGSMRRRWLPVAAFAGYLLPVALLSRRFAGHLAVPLAVLAGYGLVRLLRELELTGSRDRWRLAAAVGICVALAAPGVVLADGRIQQTTIDADLHDATRWMADDADDRGLAGRERYVFNRWGRNRMANYFVGAETLTYVYARDRYVPFLRSNGVKGWAYRLRNRDVGYVAVERLPSGDVAPPSSVYATLYRRNGSTSGDGAGCAAGFRLVHVAGDVKVFEPVRGARLALPDGAPFADVTATTTVTAVEPTFRYRCRRPVGKQHRVAYPGRYEVAVGDWRGTATVGVEDVRAGHTVRVRAE